MENNYVPYGAMGFGKTIPQPKSTYDKVWSFGLGAAGSALTIAGYTGAAATFGVSAPLTVAVGVTFSAYSLYSMIPENMSAKDYAVVSGSTFSTGLIGHGIVTGNPVSIAAGVVVGGISYMQDDHKVIKEISPSLAGFVCGAAVGKLVVAHAALQSEYDIFTGVETGAERAARDAFEATGHTDDHRAFLQKSPADQSQYYQYMLEDLQDEYQAAPPQPGFVNLGPNQVGFDADCF